MRSCVTLEMPSVSVLDERDSAANCWQRLYAICDERLRGIQISGGNKIC